jgi:hypothetical protein
MLSVVLFVLRSRYHRRLLPSSQPTGPVHRVTLCGGTLRAGSEKGSAKKQSSR